MNRIGYNKVIKKTKTNQKTICNQITKLNQLEEANCNGWLNKSPVIFCLVYFKSDKWSAQTKKSKKTKNAETQFRQKKPSMNKGDDS